MAEKDTSRFTIITEEPKPTPQTGASAVPSGPEGMPRFSILTQEPKSGSSRFSVLDNELDAVEREESINHPGIGYINNYLDFRPTVRRFMGSAALAQRGLQSMAEFPGVTTLTGVEGKGILPDIPESIPQPFRSALAGAKVPGDVLAGLGAFLLGGLGEVTAPLAQLSAPVEAVSEAVIPGTAGQVVGRTLGAGVEALAGVGIGTAASGLAATAKSQGVRNIATATERFLGSAKPSLRHPIIELPPGVSPIVPVDPAVKSILGKLFVPKFKQDVSYVSGLAELAGGKLLGKMQALRVFRELNRTAKAVSKETGMAMDGVQLEMGLALKGLSNNQRIVDAVRPVRDQINRLQQQAADAGLVTQDLVNETIDSYLSRAYMSKIAGGVWQPSKEVEDAARVWLQNNMRIPVGATDPARAAESFVVEQTRRQMMTAFRRHIRANTPDTGFAESIIAPLKREILGDARASVRDIRAFLKTKKTAKGVQETVEETVQESGGAGVKGVGDITKPAQKLNKIITDALQTRGFSKGEAESAIERIVAARASGEAGAQPTQIITKTITRTEGAGIPPERAKAAVDAANEILDNIQGTFNRTREIIGEARRGRLTKREISELEKSFNAELERVTGKGPVSFRHPTPDEVSGQVEKIVQGGEVPLYVASGGKTARIPLGPTMKRKDIPPPIRALMGEIEEGPMAAAITVDNLSRMIVAKRFLDRVATGSEVLEFGGTRQRIPWVVPQRLPGYTLAEGAGWGPLNGKYVLNKYAEDLRDFVEFSKPNGGWNIGSQLHSLWSFFMNAFKVSKTVLNPATHIRNVLGNFVFADFGDIAPWNPANIKYYQRSASELLQSGKGLTAKAIRARGQTALTPEGVTPAVREAIESGAIQTEFVSNEVLRSVTKEFSRLNPLRAALAVAKKPIEAVGRVYNAEDQVFKLAAFMKRRELGDSAEEAARFVNTWFPNYRDVSPAIKFLREAPLGAPFVTFFSEATRIFANGAKQHPVKFVKWMTIPQALSRASAAHIGMGDTEMKQLKRSLPEYLDQPFTSLMPTKDEDGNVQVVDLTYIHPLGSIFAAKRTGQWDYPFIGDFLFNNPIVNTGIEVMQNVDFFTKEEIVKPGEDQVKEITTKVTKDFLPSLLPRVPGITSEGGTAAREIEKAYRRDFLGEHIPGRFGQSRSLPQVLIGELGPVRVLPVDPALKLTAIKQKRAHLIELRKAHSRVKVELGKGKISTQEAMEQIERLQGLIREEMKR